MTSTTVGVTGRDQQCACHVILASHY